MDTPKLNVFTVTDPFDCSAGHVDSVRLILVVAQHRH